MHDFDIKTGFGDCTILFCKKCGLSHCLVKYRNDENFHAAWEPVFYKDHQGREIKPVWKPCHKEKEDLAEELFKQSFPRFLGEPDE